MDDIWKKKVGLNCLYPNKEPIEKKLPSKQSSFPVSFTCIINSCLIASEVYYAYQLFWFCRFIHFLNTMSPFVPYFSVSKYAPPHRGRVCYSVLRFSSMRRLVHMLFLRNRTIDWATYAFWFVPCPEFSFSAWTFHTIVSFFFPHTKFMRPVHLFFLIGFLFCFTNPLTFLCFSVITEARTQRMCPFVFPFSTQYTVIECTFFFLFRRFLRNRNLWKFVFW